MERMKIELDIDLFLNFATQTLDYVNLINYPEILTELQRVDIKHEHCVIDGTEVYTVNQWIFEKSRRDKLDELSERYRANNPISQPCEVTAPTKQYSKGIVGLAERLEEALKVGDTETINKIKEILKQMKEARK
jgi:hypothetical protein